MEMNKMWDVGGDICDSLEDVGFLEFVELKLDEPDMESTRDRQQLQRMNISDIPHRGRMLVDTLIPTQCMRDLVTQVYNIHMPHHQGGQVHQTGIYPSHPTIHLKVRQG
ncbi:hypothetical protein AgCh_011256 [Apium graveolens]